MKSSKPATTPAATASVAFGGFSFAGSVTRGFTNELGQLEAYTIANAGGGRQFHKMNFTIQATTALASYGTFDVNLVIQSLDAYKVGQTSNTLRFLYTTTENNRVLLYDRGHPGADTYGYEIGLPAGSTVTDLAYDQPGQLLYLCGLYRTNSSDIGFIGTVPFVSKAQTIPVISSVTATNLTVTNCISGSEAVLYRATRIGVNPDWTAIATNRLVTGFKSKVTSFPISTVTNQTYYKVENR